MKEYTYRVSSVADERIDDSKKLAIGNLSVYFRHYLDGSDQWGVAGILVDLDIIASIYFGPDLCELDESMLYQLEDRLYEIADVEFWEEAQNGLFRAARIIGGKIGVYLFFNIPADENSFQLGMNHLVELDSETEDDSQPDNRACIQCGAMSGEEHHWTCTLEPCPNCGTSLSKCSCAYVPYAPKGWSRQGIDCFVPKKRIKVGERVCRRRVVPICPECRTFYGSLHAPQCRRERCPDCGRRLGVCKCSRRSYTQGPISDKWQWHMEYRDKEKAVFVGSWVLKPQARVRFGSERRI